jgi:hypothetical protein
MDVVAARDLAEGFLAGGDALLCLLPLVRFASSAFLQKN